MVSPWLAGNRNGSEFVFGSSTVRVSVIKKSAPAPAQNDSAKGEGGEKQEEHKIAETGLQSLCQSYGSDDDGE